MLVSFLHRSCFLVYVLSSYISHYGVIYVSLGNGVLFSMFRIYFDSCGSVALFNFIFTFESNSCFSQDQYSSHTSLPENVYDSDSNTCRTIIS